MKLSVLVRATELQSVAIQVQTWKKSQACKHCLQTIVLLVFSHQYSQFCSTVHNSSYKNPLFPCLFSRSTVNKVSGRLFSIFFSTFLFSLSQPFLIERLLGSRNFFCESWQFCITYPQILYFVKKYPMYRHAKSVFAFATCLLIF